MSGAWSVDELELIAKADELEIATIRKDGTLRRWVTIWVVCVDEQVYVRTWYRRENGWYGRVLDSRRARIRLPGLEADVTVEDIGEGGNGLRLRVDAAYIDKYRRYGASTIDRMATAAAAATTLRLTPA